MFGPFMLFPAAGIFFFGAWLLMIFTGILAEDIGIRAFGYVTALGVTAALWLVMGPMLAMRARSRMMWGIQMGRRWHSQAQM